GAGRRVGQRARCDADRGVHELGQPRRRAVGVGRADLDRRHAAGAEERAAVAAHHADAAREDVAAREVTVVGRAQALAGLVRRLRAAAIVLGGGRRRGGRRGADVLVADVVGAADREVARAAFRLRAADGEVGGTADAGTAIDREAVGTGDVR